MAERGEELRPDDEEVDGGEVKSFLEHLEDLRWVLIKCGAATLIGMLVCFFSAPQLMDFLKAPLHRAASRHAAFLPEETNQLVTIVFGTNRFPAVEIGTNQLNGLDLGTNRQVMLQVEPVQIPGLSNGQFLLAVHKVTNDVEFETPGPDLIFLEPGAPFTLSLKVAFYGGLFMASPFVLYFVVQFVLPALKIREKKYFMGAFCFGLGLFLAGASFAYWGVMPAALKFAQVWGEWMHVKVPNWEAPSFISFEVTFMLGMGLGFELPVVLLALVKIGVLDYKKLSAMRRYMIVGNLVLGAILTTPEVITQICMAIALQLLFEMSVWIAWYWERKARRQARNAIDI